MSNQENRGDMNELDRIMAEVQGRKEIDRDAPEAPQSEIPQSEAPTDEERQTEQVDFAEDAVAEPAPVEMEPQPIDQAPKYRTVHIDESELDAPVLKPTAQNWADQKEAQAPKKKKRRQKKQYSVIGIIFRLLLVVALLIVLAVGSMLVVYATGDVFGLHESEEKISVTIEPNTSVSEVATLLKEKQIIEYPVVFRAYIKYKLDNQVDFNYGAFELTPNMSYDELIAQLERTVQSDKQVDITVPEGFNVVEIAERLEENHVCTKEDFLNTVNNHTFAYDFLESAYENKAGKAYVLEGYLYPDTYTFIENSDPEAVIDRFLANFDRKLSSTMRNVIRNQGYTIDEMMTLASIVQEEAPTKTEMLNVASVYRNRLNNNDTFPRMQADPTSRYAERTLLTEGFSAEVVESYDTYESSGLPPGAIANPGMDAIQSAMYPTDTEYFYFCSNLSTGEFFYANTYDQHQYNLTLAGLTE